SVAEVGQDEGVEVCLEAVASHLDVGGLAMKKSALGLEDAQIFAILERAQDVHEREPEVETDEVLRFEVAEGKLTARAEPAPGSPRGTRPTVIAGPLLLLLRDRDRAPQQVLHPRFPLCWRNREKSVVESVDLPHAGEELDRCIHGHVAVEAQ